MRSKKTLERISKDIYTCFWECGFHFRGEAYWQAVKTGIDFALGAKDIDLDWMLDKERSRYDECYGIDERCCVNWPRYFSCCNCDYYEEHIRDNRDTNCYNDPKCEDCVGDDRMVYAYTDGEGNAE